MGNGCSGEDHIYDPRSHSAGTDVNQSMLVSEPVSPKAWPPTSPTSGTTAAASHPHTTHHQKKLSYHPSLGHYTMSSASDNDQAWSSRDPFVAPPWFVEHTSQELFAQIGLIQQSYGTIAQSSTYAAAQKADPDLTPTDFLSFQFYESLFLILPSARRMFSRSIEKQGEMVQAVIVMLLERLVAHTPEALAKMQDSVRELVESHSEKRITLNQYNIVGEALVSALQHCCGPEQWTPQIERAWYMLYSALLNMVVPIFHEWTRKRKLGQVASSSNSTSISELHTSTPQPSGCPFRPA